MVVIGKKKYDAGEAVQFMSRKQALKKLQLSLNNFRRLCILKGVYPREPRNRKRAQKGDTRIKILYHKKDIQFLLHEPIIWKFRDLKVFARKVSRAKSMGNFGEMKRFLRNHPTITLDHIVKERFPTFIDALKDLDDCLTLCFLFSTFPSMPHIPRDQSELCRQLTVEFMHAVIAAKALRKVFISIKGFYFQADIKGQLITWIVPHHFGFEPQKKSEVDFKLMSTFVEFYIIMLGFVNFRLYHILNLYYPPKFTNTSISEQALVDEQAFVSERIAALNVSLVSANHSTQHEEEMEIDTFANVINSFTETDSAKIEELKVEQQKIKRLKTLFQGMKFFINREVPREKLVFVIRCFGGEVSWEKLLFVGSTFDENDETITHHIVDRPSMDKQYISRYYIQPQWVFDSVNARDLMPVEKYLIGCVLPPHLSPFSDPRHDQVYIPPEERAMMDPNYRLNYEEDASVSSEDSDAKKDKSDSEHVKDTKKKTFNEKTSNDKGKNEKNKETEANTDVVIQEEIEQKGKVKVDIKEQERLFKKKQMQVNTGKVVKEDPWEKARQEKQEFRLREKLVSNKHRKLYKSMTKGKEDRAKAIWLLCKKRRLHDEAKVSKKKESGKAHKISSKV
ncbi:pescadillo homolog isoform X2 [Copidosoma floridanum]|uniref:pescadillo homolog isoform X2 n=2 Tax=Copidosoma floridanum TaxID=29053 RepID=UPI0006C9C4F3|nr:pescadillo homolog isoform X2 [Copidosoma floridanum]